jgi:hypothetical protein
MLGWQWQADPSCLSLAVSNQSGYALTLQFELSKLRQSFTDSRAFTLEDSQLGEYFSSRLHAYLPELTDADRRSVVLHAIATVRFCPLVGLKSWHFSTQPKSRVSDVAIVQSKEDEGLGLIVEANDSVSTCLLLSDALKLDASNQMEQYSVVRIMNDRLLYIPPNA